MRHSIVKPKKKINYNRANLKRIRLFESKHPKTQKNTVAVVLLKKISSIPRFIDPLNIFRFQGDLILEDKFHNEGQLDGSLNDYSSFKKVISAVFDKELEILVLGLTNYTNVFSSGQLFIERLRSLGLASAKNLSDTVEAYFKNNIFPLNSKNYWQKPTDNTKYQCFLKRKRQLIKELNKNKMIFFFTEMQIDNESQTPQMKSFNFGNELLNLLFDSVEEAMSYFFQKQRFPEYLSFVDGYYESYSRILQKIFCNYQGKIYINLVAKNNQKFYSEIQFIQEYYVEDNYMEGYLLQLLIPNEKINLIENKFKNIRYTNDFFDGKSFKEESRAFFEKNNLSGLKCLLSKGNEETQKPEEYRCGFKMSI